MSFLSRVLLADAATCLVFGLLLLVDGNALSGPLGLPVGLLHGAGTLLLPCAALLVWLGLRPAPRPWMVWGVIALNAVWVADSVLLLELGFVTPTMLGTVFVLAQAAAVAVLAFLERAGMRRMAQLPA